MVQLTNGQFLNELVKLFQQSKDKGTVLVTMKRSTCCGNAYVCLQAPATANLKPRKTRKPDPTLPYHCLVRATGGKRKISTVVNAKEQPRFQESYNTILKAHMDSLKKREKKRDKK